MSIIIVTPSSPSVMPISSSLLKAHLNILDTETDYDQVLGMYLPAAMAEFTAYTGRALLQQTVRQSFDRFPCENYFLLERCPLISFTKLEYFDNTDTLITVDPSLYTVSEDEIAPILQLKYGKSWNYSYSYNRLNAVRATYVVGYGTDASSIPMDIKRILCMMVADSFLYRENIMAQPGIGQIVLTHSAYSAMNKYKTNFFEHLSQSRR